MINSVWEWNPADILRLLGIVAVHNADAGAVCLFFGIEKPCFQRFPKSLIDGMVYETALRKIFSLYNFLIFWFRFAGIINSIKGASTWKMRNFTEEKEVVKKIVKKDFLWFTTLLEALRREVNVQDGEQAETPKEQAAG